MDFFIHGQRIRESTEQTSKTRAKDVHDKRKQDLKDGISGIKRQKQPGLFSLAASDWLDLKKATPAPRTVMIEKANLAHLLPKFGRKLVCDIDDGDIARYQKKAARQWRIA